MLCALSCELNSKVAERGDEKCSVNICLYRVDCGRDRSSFPLSGKESSLQTLPPW